MSELRARRETPVSWVQQKTANALMALGFPNYSAQKVGHKVSNALAMLTPLSELEDATAYSRQFAQQAQRGQIPARPGGGSALNALAAIPGAKVGNGIIAYHGSPHKFDRFDMSKIGTGEGAQAYGHGLYFAENRATARAYRDDLGGRQLMVDGKPVEGGRVGVDSLGRNPRALAALHMDNAKGDWEKAVAEVEQSRAARDSGGYGYWSNEADAVLAELEKLRGARVRSKPGGSLYQVRINADPADFLDWDAPAWRQPKRARDVLSGMGLMRPKPNPTVMAMGSGEFLAMDRWGNQVGPFATKEAAEESALAAIAAQEQSVGFAGRGNIKSMEAARQFSEAGIPGIKYLDAGSRGAGDGSRNYVVFDDKLVEILKRYSWVPGMALPAAAMADYEKETGQPVQTRPVA